MNGSLLQINIIESHDLSGQKFIDEFSGIFFCLFFTSITIRRIVCNACIGFFSINADIIVDRSRTYQKSLGFGGAFNGAVSYHMQMLPEALQNHVYKYTKTEMLLVPSTQ